MSDQKATVSKSLQAPFKAEDIQWRVQQADVSAGGKPYVMVIPYVNNRAIQKRLDDVFGVFGWENVYQATPDGKGYLCGITIHLDGQTVTKWDGAEYTNIEALKGGLSDAMKRAAVQFGIGRYLYQLDAAFADCSVVQSRRDSENIHVHRDRNNKSIQALIGWSTPTLPKWALPFNDFSDFIKQISHARDMAELKEAFSNAYKAATASQDDNFMNQAVAAKDSRKAEIAKNIESINLAKFQEVEAWLDGSMKVFASMPTKSTLESYRDQTKDNLATRVKGQPFDASALFENLESTAKHFTDKLSAKN